jgi:2',5'-phosphodiesterase
MIFSSFHLLQLILFLVSPFSLSIMIRSTPAFAIRVVSYNVLSSHLASPSHFSTLDPSHLEASNRLPLVFKKLEEEMSSTESSVIFCIQELSCEWAGAMHVWCANKGYHLVTRNYGKKFNGYMGVAIAYPISTFETLDVDISRLSDKREEGWPRAPSPTRLQSIISMIQPLWEKPLQYLGLLTTAREDHWKFSERRENALITVTLKEKLSGKAFCVGNYHMPCAFYMPMAMTIHADLAARHIQKIANSKYGLPYILTGDWNIIPTSSTYKMLTEGKLPADDPSYPTPKHGMDWHISAEPMRSAYGVKTGEPDFTNFARVKEEQPFIDTLDYIFLSPEWSVLKVRNLVHRNIANGPYPNSHEPSDHVLISSDLSL